MELSERYIQLLEKEGFLTISEQGGQSGELQTFSASAVSIALLVTDGSLRVVCGAVQRTLQSGDRVDIPVLTPYLLTAGAVGYQMIMGEK